MNEPLDPAPLPEGLRAALGDVEVSPAARQSAIDAAMAVYDENFGAAAPVVDLAARRRRTHRILAAAAAVVVIAGGALAINQLTGSDSNDTQGAQVYRESPAAAMPTSAASASSVSAATVAPAESRAGGGTQMEDAAASMPLPAQSPPPGVGPIEGPAEVLVASSPADLVALAARLAPQSAPAALTCLPSAATYLGQLYYDGQPAVLVVDGSTVQALSPTDCSVLASAEG